VTIWLVGGEVGVGEVWVVSGEGGVWYGGVWIFVFAVGWLFFSFWVGWKVVVCPQVVVGSGGYWYDGVVG